MEMASSIRRVGPEESSGPNQAVPVKASTSLQNQAFRAGMTLRAVKNIAALIDLTRRLGL
jgi:hypothetical protein